MKYFMLMVLLSFGAFAQDDNFYNFADHTLVSPAEGMWYDKDEPGRGVTVEIQDGRILATYFGYKQNGDAIWWQGVGYRDDDNQNKYAGSFSTGKNGQCVGCAYTAPEFDEANSIGDFTMTFINGNEADFTWAGKDMTLVKYYYGYEKAVDRVKGLWSIRVGRENAAAVTRDFLLWNEVTAIGQGNARHKVLTGVEARFGFVAAAISVHVDGQDVYVFASANEQGQGFIYSLYLDHVSGRNDINDNTVTGGLFEFGKDRVSATQTSVLEAFRVADLDQAKPYIDYFTTNGFDIGAKSMPIKSQPGLKRSDDFIHPYIVDAIAILESVIADIYAEL